MSTYVGTFKDYKNEEQYKVTIQTGSIVDTPPQKILDPFDTPERITDDILYFSPDPVHITCDRTDLTQLIMITQCQIRLKVTQDMSEKLFADTNRSISVTVERIAPAQSAAVLFYGFVDPLQFDQGFAYNVDEITLNCTDPLGALEQIMIDQNTGIYEGDSLQAMNFLYKIFEKVFERDPNKFTGIQTFMASTINPNMIKINAGIFYGEDKDDRMSLYDTLMEILKYLGCTVCYEPNGKKIHMFNLYNNGNQEDPTDEWFNPKEDAMDDSASISMDDVYNRITLTCEIEPALDEIKLIDDDTMYSDYTNYQKYMTELVSVGEGSSAYDGFQELLTVDETHPNGGEHTSYDGGYKLDHYCYVKRNSSWDFGNNSYITAFEQEQGNGTKIMVGDQSDVLRWLKQNPGKAAFVSFGSGNKINYKDNAPINNISLTDYLVISICGHNDHGQNGHINTLFSQIQAAAPICKYTGLQSLNLTPSDPAIINYIIISGKMILNPLQRKTGTNWGEDVNWPGGDLPSNLYNASTNTYQNAAAAVGEWMTLIPYLWHRTVNHPDNSDGAYYTQKWWNCSDPRNPVYTVSNNTGIFGFLDNKENEMLKYEYTSYSNDATDIISKLPILACQLKVGDKYCVERLDLGEEGQGVFEWMTQEQWNSSSLKTKGFDRPYFTIGIDPKNGDKIVGHSFSIQNNISYKMNVDGSGTAIPIKTTDRLNGIPEFTILGPLNQEWNEIERIHPSFWRHTSWEDHKFWTLELLDSILISDLKIELKSNNALVNTKMTTADNDLMYASEMNPSYQDILDCDLKICTPLTFEECQIKGIKYQQSNSYVLTTEDEPFYGWNDGEDKLKPEVLFIDYYYQQYNSPARKLNFCVDNGWAFGGETLTGHFLGFGTILSQYTIKMQFPGITGTHNYFCMSMDWSLKRKENSMSVREMLPYTNPFN